MMSEAENTSENAALTVQLLSAYLANNTIASEDLAELIRTTRAALSEDVSAPAVEPETTTYTPAVSGRKSLASPDHILSLIDGKPYKTLKRHLASHGLTPAEYRERYNLPATYPMVAPSFAARRREIAEKIGLGGKRSAKRAEAAKALEDAAEPQANTAAAEKPARKSSAKPANAKRATSQASEPQTKSVDTAATTSAADATPPKPAAAKSAGRGGKPARGAAKPANGDANGADAAAKPKGRGKLGLFGKSDTQTGTEADNASKPVRGKRMARTSKPEAE